MTKILIARNLPPAVVSRARKLFDVTYRDQSSPLSQAEMLESLRDFDGVIPTLGDMYSSGIFAKIDKPRCRILANFGVGFNHIDTDAAKAAGLQVTNTPGAVTDATADIALTLMLMVARRAGEGDRLVRSGAWTGWHPVQMLGMHLTGKTVGIVGMGRIGQAIAQRCHYGFGMNVMYVARSEKALPFSAKRFADVTSMAPEVDILVLAVPGGPETRHLIGARQLAALGAGGFIINIARGDVIDEMALVAALQAGTIAGAGLDVYEHEPEVPAALRALDNVTLLPHLGTAALEIRENMGHMALDNLVAFFDGGAVPNPV